MQFFGGDIIGAAQVTVWMCCVSVNQHVADDPMEEDLNEYNKVRCLLPAETGTVPVQTRELGRRANAFFGHNHRAAFSSFPDFLRSIARAKKEKREEE